MGALQNILNFFDECLSFKDKIINFQNACSEFNPDEVDDESLKEAAEYYVLVKHELSQLCHYRMTKCKSDDSDDDMSISTDEDTEESDEDDEVVKSNNSSMSNTDGEVEDEVDEVDEEDEEDDDDDSVLVKSDDCCWNEILDDFSIAVAGNKIAMSAIQGEEDDKEDTYRGLEKWFEPNERNLSAKLIHTICQNFDDQGYKFIRNCPSIYIKMLVCYCKNTKFNPEEIFGNQSKLLIDDTVPLKQKRKILKGKENITKLISHIKETVLPSIKQCIQVKQMELLKEKIK